MGCTLVTGASGTIGQALVRQLAGHTDIVAMSRRACQLPGVRVCGDFAREEDLRRLDGFDIERVVHLAAATGNASEEEAFLVNVDGTRRLMRYLIGRGCRRFVLASSIAVVGLQSPRFRPQGFPIADDHPCLDRHGYGFSKFLMEEVARYYHRQHPELDIINLRLAAIYPDDAPPPLTHDDLPSEWALASLTRMSLSDAVAAFTAAVNAPGALGFQVLNAAAPWAWADRPTADVLRRWYGRDADLSYFEQPGHEWRGPFDVTRIHNTLGFAAQAAPSSGGAAELAGSAANQNSMRQVPFGC